jgi:hypothetical protein
MSEPLTKVDSAVQGIEDVPEVKETKHRRASSSANGVMNIKDLGKLHRLPNSPGFGYCAGRTTADLVVLRTEEQGIDLQIAKETQSTGW